MAANNKFKEEDQDIIALFKELKSENDKLNEETSDFTNIKPIIDNLKNKYIDRIIKFKIGYEKKDLEKNSITKLQEIYTNYKEYNDKKCKTIHTYSNEAGNYESSYLSLFVALFNKKNYILTKLFNEQYYNKNTSEAINSTIKLLNSNSSNIFKNISDKSSVDYSSNINTFRDNTSNYCNLLLETKDKTQEDIKYLTKLKIYIDNKNNDTNFYNFLYLIQNKLMKFPKNICDTNNYNYNNKIFYNVSYNNEELNLKDLNIDNKLKLNVLLENNTTEEVIIKKIPLIFIHINKKHKADNPIKTFLDTIYEIYEGFIQLFSNNKDNIGIYDENLCNNINNNIMYIKQLSKIFITNDSDNRNIFKKEINDNYEATKKIAEGNVIMYTEGTLIHYFGTYFKKLLETIKLLLHNIDDKIECLNLVKQSVNNLDNAKLFETIVSNTMSDNDEYKENTYIDKFIIYIDQLKNDSEEFKKYIDNVNKIIDDDISDGLNSFEQFTDTELSGLQVDIKPKKVSFGQTLEIGDNVLYLNSIVIKHKITEIYTDYKYICIFECNGKWYSYDCKKNAGSQVQKISDDFDEMYKWTGHKDDVQSIENNYVQKNVVGLFYT
jgi:hypothetical protein